MAVYASRRAAYSAWSSAAYVFRVGVERAVAPWESGCMKTDRDLTQRIEELVRELADEHMAQVRQRVVATVMGALAGTTTTAPQHNKATKKGKRAPSRRRDPAEVTAVAERLHKAVCAKPGEAMVVFATELDTTVRELHRPMANLKRSGRVRSVGERHRTRYFPGLATAAASEAATEAA